jgi:hypothetical protein
MWRLPDTSRREVKILNRFLYGRRTISRRELVTMDGATHTLTLWRASIL